MSQKIDKDTSEEANHTHKTTFISTCNDGS